MVTGTGLLAPLFTVTDGPPGDWALLRVKPASTSGTSSIQMEYVMPYGPPSL
jgi:hypothetical protein